MTFTIRRYRPADAPYLPDIERSAGNLFRTVPELAWVADGDDLPVERHLEFIAMGTSWVVEAGDDQVVGFLCAEVTGDTLHIWEFSVARDHQNRGLGRALLEEAISFARQRQLSAVTLTTFRAIPWNEPVYWRMGFVTLQPDENNQRLNQIFDAEVVAGLPREHRCAMRLSISDAQSP